MCGRSPRLHPSPFQHTLLWPPLRQLFPRAPLLPVLLGGSKASPKGLSAFSVPNLRYCPAFAVTSAQQMVSLPEGEARIAVIGERINPTGKKKLKAALQAGDVDYLVAEAAAQQRAGADILDVNVGVPGLDERRSCRRSRARCRPPCLCRCSWTHRIRPPSKPRLAPMRAAPW